MHPGKMHHDKMVGVGKGVLLFCEVAKGQVGEHCWLLDGAVCQSRWRSFGGLHREADTLRAKPIPRKQWIQGIHTSADLLLSSGWVHPILKTDLWIWRKDQMPAPSSNWATPAFPAQPMEICPPWAALSSSAPAHQVAGSPLTVHKPSRKHTEFQHLLWALDTPWAPAVWSFCPTPGHEPKCST